MDRLRKRSRHQRPLYYFSDTESDTISDEATSCRDHAKPTRSSQRIKAQQSIRDENEEESSETTSIRAITSISLYRTVQYPSIAEVNHRKQVNRKPKRRKIATRSSTLKSPPRPRVKVVVPVRVKSGGIIPPWQNLDYQILLKVMQYAAYPLYEGASRDTGSIQWLLDISRLCFSFRDACVGALMASPPLYPANRAHGILKLLQSSTQYYDASQTQPNDHKVSLDYRTKVKRLDVEVRHILLKKQGIALRDLLACTPLLKDLRLYHSHDALIRDFLWAQPQYAKGKRWGYGALFAVLDELNIELTSFEWNGRFLRQDLTLDTIRIAHGQRCLHRLKSLTLLHLGVHAETDENQLGECRVSLLNALESLNTLEDLSIHNCDVLDGPTMVSLPCVLRRLTIGNCLYVTSEAVQEYLTSNGYSLLVLRLLHNQSMSLHFMSSLQTTTPKLQHIEIDLTYHDTTSFRDTEPLFDSLLPSGPPTWPSNLTYISVEPLRLLTTADAEAFFESLVSSASQLSHLRELRLKTILHDTGWRDRAQLRSKWGARMIEIFLSGVRYNIAQREKHKQTNDHAAPSTTHGTCHTVEFELSDQRPAQEQYKEADFLDAEPSDDAEWNGRDDASPSKYSARRYAW